jgi:co-chaperonin GroES (HSP10)
VVENEGPASPAGCLHPLPLTSNKLELGAIKFEAFGDRILIQEDEFKSGYECDTCSGAGIIECVECAGAGKIGVKKCSTCEGKGSTICAECGGKGGILVVPEVSQRRPTTGTIVSVGEDVEALKVGQAVMYSSYAGHTVDLDRAGIQMVMRILHEPEVLCLVEGHLELRTIRGKSEIASFQN